jgi:hypothetical protein
LVHLLLLQVNPDWQCQSELQVLRHFAESQVQR